MNFFRKHLASYRHAFRGIRFAFRYEHNMIIHLLAAAAVVALNMYVEVSRTEWIITIILIGVVWMAEIFNTALERLADHVSREHHPLIGQAKDLSAGAVLMISLVAVVCAMIIYWPYIMK